MRIKENDLTSESVWLSKRKFLAGMGFAALGTFMPTIAFAEGNGQFPPRRNNKYTLDGRALTPEVEKLTYNNFYEFGTSKGIWSVAKNNLDTTDWKVKISGLVDRPMEMDIDQINKLGLEERLYRFRCVEAWSASVPWAGVQMSTLAQHVGVQNSAKYVTFISSDNIAITGALQWPYIETLRMDEAMNELTLLATGLYGRPLEKQSGAPIRLVVPWKYGFKYGKTITEIRFTEELIPGTWDSISREYGFFANVNPEVDHRRWSQRTERSLTTGDRIPTLKWNGYGEQVAQLYTNDDPRELFY